MPKKKGPETMVIQITLLIEDEDYVDRNHEMGITNETYERLVSALSSFGSVEDIQAM